MDAAEMGDQVAGDTKETFLKFCTTCQYHLLKNKYILIHKIQQSKILVRYVLKNIFNIIPHV